MATTTTNNNNKNNNNRKNLLVCKDPCAGDEGIGFARYFRETARKTRLPNSKRGSN
jgi:hypothetical protein